VARVPGSGQRGKLPITLREQLDQLKASRDKLASHESLLGSLIEELTPEKADSPGHQPGKRRRASRKTSDPFGGVVFMRRQA
jgi:hypothetical protein